MTLHTAGLKIGHVTDSEHHTGCTVFLCPAGTLGSVDVRGPAPGGRETTLLQPDKHVTTLNAVVFAGGSAFGLATADGVMQYLKEHNIGHVTPIRPIPIVPAAIVYDLFLGGGQVLPDAAMGYQACLNASETNFAQGNVGVGAGVTVGKWGGFKAMMKGGFGLASAQEGELVVFAAAVVNSVGDVLAEDGSVLAGARAEDGSWLVQRDPWRRFPELPPVAGTNTTLALVATNARFTKAQAQILAQRVQDGVAIAVRPRTIHDGDTAFALSTGPLEASFDLVSNIALEMTVEAIRNGVRQAHTVAGVAGRLETRD